MTKKIKLNGEEIELTIKPLCHKGEFGNYKFTIEKKIRLNLKTMSEKLPTDFKLERLHKLFMIIKKEPISISIAQHGRIMVEKVSPDTPERALDIIEPILKTITGYEGIIE